jgi:hypothetical protein
MNSRNLSCIRLPWPSIAVHKASLAQYLISRLPPRAPSCIFWCACRWITGFIPTAWKPLIRVHCRCVQAIRFMNEQNTGCCQCYVDSSPSLFSRIVRGVPSKGLWHTYTTELTKALHAPVDTIRQFVPVGRWRTTRAGHAVPELHEWQSWIRWVLPASALLDHISAVSCLIRRRGGRGCSVSL